ncbi:MAG: hypothetical protein R2799_09195 [Crocinitomicaceae bacterium]
MDLETGRRFNALIKHLEPEFGPELNLQSILFLIGVQEYGKGYQKFTKDQKVDLMHVAICTLLEPHGYYEFKGRDEENWPHFEAKENLPSLKADEQQELITLAILDYFEF